MCFYVFLFTLFLFMLLLSSSSAVPIQTALSWNIQTIDEKASALSDDCPITVDSNSTTHIAFCGRINQTYFVEYASWNGSGFSTQIVGEGAYAYGIKLDADNNPHITYGANPTGYIASLMYATTEETTQTPSPTITSSSAVPPATSL